MTTDDKAFPGGDPDTAGITPQARYSMELSALEQQVLSIAKDLMRKHYLLDLQDLQAQAGRLLKDFKIFAIQQAIDGLCRKKILFGGSAITRDTVLENQTRRAIYENVCKYPGIHFSAIRRSVDKDSRTTMVHLRVLERFEMIRSENFNSSKAYYDFFLTKQHDLFFHYLRKDKVLDIYAALVSQPGISLSKLASAFGEEIPYPTLYRKVKILLESNLLAGTFDGGQLVSLAIPPGLLQPLTRLLSSQ